MHKLLILFLFPLLCFAQAPNFIELDLRALESTTTSYPSWLEEVTEVGGEITEEAGWQIPSSKPFGIGRLYLTIDSESLPANLALSFFSSSQSNIAVQLYDANEHTLAVDLLAKQTTQAEGDSLTTLIIPLSNYPSAKHIVLRRLNGPISIKYLSLIELTEVLTPEEANPSQLAALLGDPRSPANPFTSSLVANNETGTANLLLSGITTDSQPLFKLGQTVGEHSLSEGDLINIFQILGLQGYDFNAIDFVRAAGEGREEVVKLYLQAGMPINVQGRNRYTAVAEAATSGELRVLKLLCDQGADLEIRTAGGNSALWMACIGNHYEAIRLLIEYGADPNAKGAYGNTPLHKIHQRRAHNYNAADACTIYLLENGANPDIQTDKGNTILHEIVRYGRTSTLKQVLSFNPDTNIKDNAGFTPMMAAQYRNSRSIENALLEAGVAPWTPTFDSLDDELVYRVYRNNSSHVYQLLEQGADPNTLDMNGEALVFQIIDIRNLQMLKRFRTAGLKLDVRDNYGHSPLGHVNSVFSEAREALVDYLLEEGLDPNYATQEELQKKHPYWTPLMIAADSGNAYRCNSLLAAGADPRVKNLPGRTAAVIAERAGYFQLAQELKMAEKNYQTGGQ